MGRVIAAIGVVSIAFLLMGSAGAVLAADPIDSGSRWLWGPLYPRPKPPPPSPAPARRPVRDADVDAATYDRCLTMAKSDPAAAREMAQSWQRHGGAHPADHCFAVSLMGLKQYKEAAERLEKLQQDMVRAPASLRADVLGQAAQAWLLAGNPGRSYTADTNALALRPDDPDLLLDRATAAGTAGWYDKAIADLDTLLKTDPSRVDALIFRASANRALDRLDPALADVERALSLAPDSAPALLERGYIKGFRGDPDGAREDWRRVIALAPESSDAAAAKTNLARLDAARAKPEPPPPTTPGQAERKSDAPSAITR